MLFIFIIFGIKNDGIDGLALLITTFGTTTIKTT